MEPDEDQIIPVIEEEVVARAEPVKTGSVRVEKHVERRIRRVDLPLLRETVEVKRVAVNRVVEHAPRARKEGGTIIVPVLEEEIVVTRRLILKEEIHLIRRRTKEHVTRDVPVERERAVVKRLDEKGRVIDRVAKTRPRSIL